MCLWWRIVVRKAIRASAIKPQGTRIPIPLLTEEGEPVDALQDVGLATDVVEDEVVVVEVVEDDEGEVDVVADVEEGMLLMMW